MVKRLSGEQELGELVSTARNTYVNAGILSQFDFHQSVTSKVSFPLLSFPSSNDLMEAARACHLMTSIFITSVTSLRSNLRVFIQIEYPVESLSCLPLSLSPFLVFHCLFPVIDYRSNNGVNVCLDHLCF